MVLEQSYYLEQGGTLRPFKMSSGTNTRGYSLPIQRAMTDFGSDESFGKACGKVKEHYGVSIPVSGERNVTLRHAKRIKQKLKEDVKAKNMRKSKQVLSSRIGDSFIISETDGSMAPIVVTKKSKTSDNRKHKEVMYREARLTLAHSSKSTVPVFSVTFGDVTTTGNHIRYCVDKAGCGGNSQIHAIGDGAPWIADQVATQFGGKAKYLIDFYHASGYLAAASHECAMIDPLKWLHAQQQLLKCGKYETVLINLSNYAHEHEDSATYKCYNYLKNRTHQLHYDEAIRNQLPIGSGEIESAHRYIIQNRIKITGAWWLEDNAESMANLGVHRANQEWDNYWISLNAA